MFIFSSTLSSQKCIFYLCTFLFLDKVCISYYFLPFKSFIIFNLFLCLVIALEKSCWVLSEKYKKRIEFERKLEISLTGMQKIKKSQKFGLKCSLNDLVNFLFLKAFKWIVGEILLKFIQTIYDNIIKIIIIKYWTLCCDASYLCLKYNFKQLIYCMTTANIFKQSYEMSNQTIHSAAILW